MNIAEVAFRKFPKDLPLRKKSDEEIKWDNNFLDKLNKFYKNFYKCYKYK